MTNEKKKGLSVLELLKRAKAREAVSGTSVTRAADPIVHDTNGTGEFDVILTHCAPDQKVKLIKFIREVTGQGLREAKETVDAAVDGLPCTLKRNVSRDEALEIKAHFEAAGATIEFK